MIGLGAVLTLEATTGHGTKAAATSGVHLPEKLAGTTSFLEQLGASGADVRVVALLAALLVLIGAGFGVEAAGPLDSSSGAAQDVSSRPSSGSTVPPAPAPEGGNRDVAASIPTAESQGEARAANGDKQYGVAHLLPVLQIKRLVGLEVPLAQVATMGRAEEDPGEALRLLCAELAASIERLQRVRAELVVVLRRRAPVDLPAVFSTVAGDLTETRVFDEHWLDDLRQLLADEPRTDSDVESGQLSADTDADADEATRPRIAEGLAPALRPQAKERALLANVHSHAAHGPSEAEATALAALRELSNPAQPDVLHRANLVLQDTPADHVPDDQDHSDEDRSDEESRP